MKKTTQFFPAANTPEGFYSCFDQVISNRTAHKIIYIKGGSGCGKSTLMRKLGDDAVKKGYQIELLHCSSDPDSLDGLHILETNSAIFDATAPHVMDPVYPGIVDEIFNIGDFWDSAMLVPHKEKIMELGDLKKACFASAYVSFRQAKAALKPVQGADDEAVRKTFQELKAAYFDVAPKEKKEGTCRRLFASGLTPQGNVNFLKEILRGTLICLTGNRDVSSLLTMVRDDLVGLGYQCDAFYCPMFPAEKLEHLVIPELSLSFTTGNSFHTADGAARTISLSPPESIGEAEAKERIAQGISQLKKAKAYHGEIESIYIKAMDFDALNHAYPLVRDKLIF